MIRNILILLLASALSAFGQTPAAALKVNSSGAIIAPPVSSLFISANGIQSQATILDSLSNNTTGTFNCGNITITFANVSGNGGGLTNLAASALTGALPAISGAALTSLNASNISSGTLSDSRLAGDVVLTSGSFANPSWITSLASTKLTNPGSLTTLNLNFLNPTFYGLGSTPIYAANLINSGGAVSVDLNLITFKLYGIAFPTSNAMNFGNMGHVFSHQSAAESGFESNELLLTGNNANENVFSVQNLAPGGYSAITSRDLNGREKLAVGYGNTSTIPTMFAGTNYIENWSGFLSSPTAPPRFLISSDGNYGTFGGGLRFYPRFTVEPDGTPVFWKLIPWADGTEQRRAIDISDTFVSGLMSSVSKTFQGTLLTFASNGNKSDTEPTGYQAELRAGPDDNAAIVIRSCENIDVFTGGNATDFHIYGGNKSAGGGYRFYTGIRDAGPVLQLQIATDQTAINNPLCLTPQAAPGSPSEGFVYYDSSAHALELRNASAWNTVLTESAGYVALVSAAPTINGSVGGGSGSLELQGNDANASIFLREGSADHNDFYSYGGTLSAGFGHRFYTGGLKASQTMRVEIADDQTNITNILSLTPQAAPSSPTEGMIYVDSSTHHLECYLSGAWHQLDN